MKYSPPLDGMRAIAILAVLVFHTWPGAMRGGFTGVDVFFVLSGYLITSVILHDVQAGRFRMREFYLRRIQRLMPNALLAVLATMLLSWWLLLPSAATQVAEHGLWTVFQASNFWIRSHVGGYWGEQAGSVPLLHTWSLAVEEQFYLLFPWVLVMLVRRRRAAPALAVALLASLALGVYSTAVHPVAAFYLLPMRGWELLLGAVLALEVMSLDNARSGELITQPVWRECLGWAGLGGMLAGFVFIRDDAGFPGMVALLPALGALAVIAATAGGRGSLARLLGTSFLVETGRRSYALYLWHWPLIVIGREFADLVGWPVVLGAMGGLAASIAMAVLVYRLVELPLRQRGPGRPRRLGVIAALVVATVVAGAVLVRMDVHADARALFEPMTFSGQVYNLSADAARRQTGVASRFSDVEFASAPPLRGWPWRDGGLVHAWGPGAPRVVVFGSSHALMYAATIDSLCRERALPVAFLTVDGAAALTSTLRRDGGACFPAHGMLQDFVETRRVSMRAWQPDVVLVIDRWDRYQPEPRHFAAALEEFTQEFGPSTRALVYVSQVPVVRVGERSNLREIAAWYHRLTGNFPELSADSRQGFRDSTVALFAEQARVHPGVQLLALDDLFRDASGGVKYVEGREFLYLDDDHLTQAGAWSARSRFAAVLDASTGPSRPRPSVTPLRSAGATRPVVRVTRRDPSTFAGEDE